MTPTDFRSGIWPDDITWRQLSWAYSAPCHYMGKGWLFVNWTLGNTFKLSIDIQPLADLLTTGSRNKPQWKLINMHKFSSNAFGNIVCTMPVTLYSPHFVEMVWRCHQTLANNNGSAFFHERQTLSCLLALASCRIFLTEFCLISYLLIWSATSTDQVMLSCKSKWRQIPKSIM